MRLLLSRFEDEAFLRRFGKYGVYTLLAAGLALIVWSFVGPARAEGVSKGSPIALPGINATSWTGCGFGVGGSYLDGELSGVGPVNAGADGQMLDVRLLCDMQVGSFVIGGNIDYGWIFGDLNTLGADTTWAVGGRVGPLINPNTLLFMSGGWTRVDTSSVGNLDGYYFGGGIETKLPGSPLYFVLEYRHNVFDASDICGPDCPFDATADVIRAGVNIKLHFWK